MDATWPDDVWENTFTIRQDGSVNVEYKIVMAVPDHADRPIDYLNFGEKESDFKAIDSETGNELKIEVVPREHGQTVWVYPDRELHRGDRYRYCLTFTIPDGFLQRLTEHCFLVEWGWGNWPLEYTISFVLPPKACVYHASANLHEKGVRNDQPFLVFKDRSEHDTSIHVLATFYFAATGAIQLVMDRAESGSSRPTVDATYSVGSDANIQVNAKITVPGQCGKIDLPMGLFGRHFSSLAIRHAITNTALNYMELPVPVGDRQAIVWMRIHLSGRAMTEESSQVLITFLINDRASALKRTGNSFRLFFELGLIEAHWKLAFELPPRMLVIFALPKPTDHRIRDGKPVLYYELDTETLSPLSIEMLFKQSSESEIRLGYRFIAVEVPKTVEADQPFSIPYTITNTLPDSCDFTVQAELSGFQESSATRKMVALKPGTSLPASITLVPKANVSKGTVQFWVHAEGKQTEVTQNYEIAIQSALVRIRRCFKIGVQSCPKPDLKLKRKTVFVGMPFRDLYEDHYNHAILPALQEMGLKVNKADEEIGNIAIMCKVCRRLQETEYGIINLSGSNPNVLLELGILYGLGKSVLLIKYAEDKDHLVDLDGMERLEYSNIDQLKEALRSYFSGLGLKAKPKPKGAKTAKRKPVPSTGAQPSSEALPHSDPSGRSS